MESVIVIEEQLKKIIAIQLGRKAEDLAIESDLINDLGADSLDVVEIVVSIEETFGIKIEDAEYTELKTLQELVELIKSKLEK
jgi:acyl carrier protein